MIVCTKFASFGCDAVYVVEVCRHFRGILQSCYRAS